MLYFSFLRCCCCSSFFFFFSSRRRHTRSLCDWSSDVCSSDLGPYGEDGTVQPLHGAVLAVRAVEEGEDHIGVERSEERRVGKESRSRWAGDDKKKKKRRQRKKRKGERNTHKKQRERRTSREV